MATTTTHHQAAQPDALPRLYAAIRTHAEHPAASGADPLTDSLWEQQSTLPAPLPPLAAAERAAHIATVRRVAYANGYTCGLAAGVLRDRAWSVVAGVALGGCTVGPFLAWLVTP